MNCSEKLSSLFEEDLNSSDEEAEQHLIKTYKQLHQEPHDAFDSIKKKIPPRIVENLARNMGQEKKGDGKVNKAE